MPGSDEVFGGELTPSMFPNLMPPGLGAQPTPEEMAAQFEAYLHTKQVRLKDVGVKTFDLSKAAQVKAYRKLYAELYRRVSRGETLVKEIDKRFVKEPQPRWIVHIEWWDYALVVDGKEVSPEELEQIRQKDSAIPKGGIKDA